MPAHTLLLRNGIFIVENLRSLASLHGKTFRFFALPLAVEGATSFPVRAFAEIPRRLIVGTGRYRCRSRAPTLPSKRSGS